MSKRCCLLVFLIYVMMGFYDVSAQGGVLSSLAGAGVGVQAVADSGWRQWGVVFAKKIFFQPTKTQVVLQSRARAHGCARFDAQMAAMRTVSTSA